MRVLMITAHYQPEPNFITADVARALAQRGHDITVLTAHPNYPLGHFYESVDSLWPRQTTEDGVKVWRLPFFPDHSLSKIKRAISYLSFALMAAVWAPFVCRSPQVVIVYQTPFTTALAALWHKWVRRSKTLFVCCDLWPESFSATGVVDSGVVMNSAYAYSRWINTQADLMVCSTHGMVSRYRRDGIAAERLRFAPAWTDGLPKTEQRILPDPIAKHETHRIVYAGNLGAAQGLSVVIQAAKICAKEAPKTHFDIYGTGTDHETLLAQASGLQNVTFHGRVSPEAAFEATQKAMAVLVHLVDTPLFRMTLPSKLGAAFAAGGIVLAGLTGEGAQVTENSKSGLTFEPGSARQLVDAILRVQQMSPEEYERRVTSSFEFYEHYFEKTKLCAQYCEWIEELVTGPSATRPG